MLQKQKKTSETSEEDLQDANPVLGFSLVGQPAIGGNPVEQNQRLAPAGRCQVPEAQSAIEVTEGQWLLSNSAFFCFPRVCLFLWFVDVFFFFLCVCFYVCLMGMMGLVLFFEKLLLDLIRIY